MSADNLPFLLLAKRLTTRFKLARLVVQSELTIICNEVDHDLSVFQAVSPYCVFSSSGRSQHWSVVIGQEFLPILP